jgi:hypothetical protein
MKYNGLTFLKHVRPCKVQQNEIFPVLKFIGRICILLFLAVGQDPQSCFGWFPCQNLNKIVSFT